jgi:hypothetical protein
VVSTRQERRAERANGIDLHDTSQRAGACLELHSQSWIVTVHDTVNVNTDFRT